MWLTDDDDDNDGDKTTQQIGANRSICLIITVLESTIVMTDQCITTITFVTATDDASIIVVVKKIQ